MAYDCYVENKLTKDIQFCAGKTNCLTHIPNDINLELDPLNVTVVGSPTITNGVASEFSTSNYLIFNGAGTVPADNLNSFEIAVKVTTPTTWTSNGRVINPTNGADSTTAPFIQVVNSGAELLWYNGTTYIGFPIGITLSSNTTYWFKWVYDGSTIKYYYSTNGSDYILSNTTTPPYKPYFNSTEIGIGCRVSDKYAGCVWNGSVDLKETYIKVNGKYWWKGGSGNLTLKAGSKVYVSNGFESDGTTPKFDVVVIASDVLDTFTTIQESAQFIVSLSQDKNLHARRLDTQQSSGTIPTGINDLFYNTTLNKVSLYFNNNILSDNVSFPLCIVSYINGTGITSIDQVFNGFGYIGSTIFALPGVKGLIPDGWGEGGRYKTKEVTLSDVWTYTYSGTGSVNNYWFVGSTFDAYNPYYIQSSQPTAKGMWYDTKNNLIKRSTDGGVTWEKRDEFFVGTFSVVSGKVTSLTINPVQTNNSTIQIKRIHKGADLIWIKDKFIMEQRNTGTYTLNIEFTGNYRLLFVGNGGGGGSGQRDSKWFQSSGGSGACFEGIVKLTKGTYTVTLGTLGYGYNKNNTSDLTGGVNSTDSYLTDSNGNELIIVGCGARGTSASAGGVGGTLTLGTIEVLKTIKAKNGNQGNSINNGSPSSTSGYALSAYDNTKTGYGAGTGSWSGGGNVYGVAGIIKIEVA